MYWYYIAIVSMRYIVPALLQTVKHNNKTLLDSCEMVQLVLSNVHVHLTFICSPLYYTQHIHLCIACPLLSIFYECTYEMSR